MSDLQRVPPVERPPATVAPTLDDIADDPGAGARDARRPDAQASSASEHLPAGERALLGDTGEPSRKCENPECRRPLTGRAAKRACSPRCRAALSRRRRSKTRAEQDRRALALVSEVVGLLEEIRALLARQADQTT